MSKPSDIRYTPPYIIEPVRRVLGTIDLDPCSCLQANYEVGAEKFYTEQQDGLLQEWHGNVWLNWPGSKARAFSEKLHKEVSEGRVKKAAVMLFNWDHSTRWFSLLHELNPLYALFKHRVKFENANHNLFEVGRSQAIAFIGCPYMDVKEVYVDENVYLLEEN